jgi:hypothetical protein
MRMTILPGSGTIGKDGTHSKARSRMTAGGGPWPEGTFCLHRPATGSRSSAAVLANRCLLAHIRYDWSEAGVAALLGTMEGTP